MPGVVTRLADADAPPRSVVLVVLSRTEPREDCTIGRLVLPAASGAPLVLATMEPPWRDNRPGVSCIPEGEYVLEPGFFYRGGYPTWEVAGVRGRSLIKVHRGNFATETRGCILVGMRSGELDERPAVLDSLRAHRLLMAALTGSRDVRLVVRRDELTTPPDGPA